MISYIIEFAILHTLFYCIYKVMLARETQLGLLRLFLVGASCLSLILPAIEIPTKATVPTLNVDAYVLPLITITGQEQSQNIPWHIILPAIISLFFALKIAISMVQIYGWYRESETDSLGEIMIRKVSGLQNSFTFFQWIFIDPKNFEHPEDIIRHEHGHAKKWHTVDLLFFHFLTIFFWWLPSIWLVIKELRVVHEFEADNHALSIDNKTYTKTLVHSTLKAHGMNLASSFDDAPIFNRLNFIKKMKKKISIWKVASIVTMVAISGAIFACEDDVKSNNQVSEILDTNLETQNTDALDEVFIEVDESATFPGGLNAFYEYMSANLAYPKQAQQLGVEGRVFVQFIIEKDGSITNIEVVKGIGAGCDKAALEIMKNSPDWIPAKVKGKPVRMKLITNIAFKLPS